MFTKFTLGVLFFCIGIFNIFITYEMYSDLATYFKYAVISFPLYYLIFLFIGSFRITTARLSFQQRESIRKEMNNTSLKGKIALMQQDKTEEDRFMDRVFVLIKMIILLLTLSVFKIVMYFFIT